MSKKSVLERLTSAPTLDVSDLGLWEADSELLLYESQVVMQGLKLKDVFASSAMTLEELRALYMKKLKQKPDEKSETIQKSVVMAGLSAMGNSQQVLRMLVKKEELRAMMAELNVLAGGRYNPTNPYNFPLSFYGRLFPEARHRVGAELVAPRFTALTFPFLDEPHSKFATEFLAQYVYPGGAAVVPKIEGSNAKKLYTGLMTAVSIIISRKASGEGTWKSVTVEQTKQFMNTVAGDGHGTKKTPIADECPAFDIDAFLKGFCMRGSLYAAHPLYGAERSGTSSSF